MVKNWKNVAVGALLAALLLMTAGCGQKIDYVSEINVYNWGDYIDPDVISSFERDTKIKVNYEMFDTNEDMYIKIKQGAGHYDVAIPSDYMIEKMVNEGMVEPINFDHVPNAQYIGETFKGLNFDPDNRYAVPYMWGTVGIVYNKALMNEVPDSWAYLWDAKYDQSIYMLNSQRDSLAVALKYLGYSINTRDQEQLAQAEKALIAQKPLVLAYVGDEVKDQMIQGSAAMAVMWSGDAAYVMAENPDLDYAIPREGTNYWFDAMVIPSTVQNKAGAEAFINYMCETEVSRNNVDYIGYSTPQMETMKILPQEVVNDKRFYPTAEDLKNSEVFADLADVLPVYDEIWSRVTAN